MARKDLKTIRRTVGEANTQIKKDFSPAYWAFLISYVGYGEVTFDTQAQQIAFAEYIPLKDLLAEFLTKRENGSIAVTHCRICEQYFDMNTADGIFGDTVELARFICRSRATTLTAWDFYQQHLKID